ncbi:hypothetical protein KUV50_18115 [Membranicola marinus]|uniref:Lipocalin-like domain-containing protein n=1 Tax=Membranihabitans marinus TaxID=1227546 RepID=A0A953LBS5_9BACT|nr:hypothetical protein [Membranihabitans marinus]MBY5960073.1 hypothetical protein [Membranihabitans marinus]
MRNSLFIFLCTIFTLTSCTDNHAEKLIEGNWRAVKLSENEKSIEHELPEGIRFHFEYPKYTFQGEKSEQGNYYIKNDHLHLLPDGEETERNLSIQNLSADTLALELIDSLSGRTVYFLRNKN